MSYLAFTVPRTGLEPARLAALAPETSASTIPPPGHYLFVYIGSAIRRETFVGVKGFEPSTPCSQSRCANRTALRPENLCKVKHYFFIYKSFLPFILSAIDI